MRSPSSVVPVPTTPAAAPLPAAGRPRPSNVALKVTMAVSGTIFALYVLVHMVGNLKVYTGAGHFDAYAHWLRTLGEPLLPHQGALWLFRVVLLASLIAHVGASLILLRRGRRARGPFRRTAMGWRRLPAVLMPWTGLVLLVFVVVHVLDLTTGTQPIAPSEFQAPTESASHAYQNLVESLQRWPMAAFYLFAMLMLGLHLVHGLWSLATDFGATGRRTRQIWALAALVFAIVVVAGDLSIPLAVLAGWVR